MRVAANWGICWYVGVFVAVLLGAGVLVTSVQARELPEQKITIAPAHRELAVAPGERITGRLTVANKGSESFRVRPQATPYSVVGLGYRADFRQVPGTTSPHEWIRFSEVEPVVLSPGRTVDVVYEVTVPPKTAPGGYYAVVFAESSPDSAATGAVTTRNRAGQILFITVKGPVVQTGSVRPLKLALISFSGETDLSSDIKNEGGLHFLATSSLAVYDLFGRRVWGQDIARYVLPQTERRFQATWSSGTVLGAYKITRSATLLGRTEVSSDAWVVVVHPLLATGLGALFLVAVTRFMLRRHRNSSTPSG